MLYSLICGKFTPNSFSSFFIYAETLISILNTIWPKVCMHSFKIIYPRLYSDSIFLFSSVRYRLPQIDAWGFSYLLLDIRQLNPQASKCSAKSNGMEKTLNAFSFVLPYICYVAVKIFGFYNLAVFQLAIFSRNAGLGCYEGC